MSLLKFPLVFWTRKRQPGEISNVERDYTLRVFMNDTRCELVVLGINGELINQLERLASDNPLDSKSLLLAAAEALSPELERRIGIVEVFLDDEEISVVDSRQAKLSHFEGRALAEFGKYQLGGKPVCFASHRFGETSAQETEKRIVAYISEDRLTAVLYALGKLARFTTFFGPWSLQRLLASASEETQAYLAVHSNYSTLALANNLAGAVAVRHLPVGTANLTQAYAKVHGIDDKEAAKALHARSRLTIGQEWPLPADAPAALVGTHIALAPVLTQLWGEIGATVDYFEFQRLAGRATELNLSVLGSHVAGFARWLSDMLHINVTDAEKSQTLVRTAPPVLNLLEGMRTGLLKIGNQRFDFVGGRFVASADVSSRSTGRSRSDVVAKWKSASSQPVTLATFRPMAGPLAATAVFVLAMAAGYAFVLAPMDQASQDSLNLYSGVLSQMDQAKAGTVRVASEPRLWARDMMSVGSAMPYDMKLIRIALLSGASHAGETVEISGTLPKGGADNLQLIGRFMTRLSASPALRHRFTEVNFAGTGAGETDDADETTFKVVAKVAAGAMP